jgi:cytochrome c peroxidase
MRKVVQLSLVAVGCWLASGHVTSAHAQAGGGLGDLSALKSQYRRAPARPITNQALVDLGRDLFFDPTLSASGKTACASCHFPELGWTVAEARSTNDAGKPTPRRSQSLVGIGHQGSAPIGWDGRSPTLEAQAKASIATGAMSMRETPTPVPVDVIVERIRNSPAYVTKFKAALPEAKIDIDSIAHAISEFERTIEPGTAPFDRWVAGDETAIPEAAKRGFALYSGKALCIACHRGWRFTDDQFHDIGTTTTDRGRGGNVTDNPMMQFAFKTPTLRDVALHPPYMHNGTQATLEEVVKHYEKGGIARASRSPMMQPITLTDAERRDLVAFMETLSGETLAGAASRK